MLNAGPARLGLAAYLAQGEIVAATFDWDDAEEIGIQLAEKYPAADPLSVRYTDLHKWVTTLDGFTGDPKLSNEGKLEAIQMAWLEEHNERKA